MNDIVKRVMSEFMDIAPTVKSGGIGIFDRRKSMIRERIIPALWDAHICNGPKILSAVMEFIEATPEPCGDADYREYTINLLLQRGLIANAPTPLEEMK